MTLIDHNPAETLHNPSNVLSLQAPEWFQQLDSEARVSLRAVAHAYMAEQDHGADVQEAALLAAGVKVDVSLFDDPYTDPARRQVMDEIIETSIGMRLSRGDAYVYHGDRRRGPDTLFTEAFKGLSPAMAYWHSLVPSAAALSPLYRPDMGILPDKMHNDGTYEPGQPIDPMAEAVFSESLDGRAIRSRGEAIRQTYIDQFMDKEQYPEGSEIHVGSLACGSAEVMIQATSELHRMRPDLRINVQLADMDESALRRAEQSVESLGKLEGVTFSFIKANILRESDLRLVTAATGGKGFDLIEFTGFFEYLSDLTAKKFMRQAYDMVTVGGKICGANMRNTHRQLDFTLNCVRWPHIRPRSLTDLVDITEDACGVDQDAIAMTLPADGAYAVFTVQK